MYAYTQIQCFEPNQRRLARNDRRLLGTNSLHVCGGGHARRDMQLGLARTQCIPQVRQNPPATPRQNWWYLEVSVSFAAVDSFSCAEWTCHDMPTAPVQTATEASAMAGFEVQRISIQAGPLGITWEPLGNHLGTTWEPLGKHVSLAALSTCKLQEGIRCYKMT